MIFDDDDLKKIGNAFDRAWDRFLRMGMLNPKNFQRSQDTLARSILMHACNGEHDEWRIARHAFLHLSRLESHTIKHRVVCSRRSTTNAILTHVTCGNLGQDARFGTGSSTTIPSSRGIGFEPHTR